MTNRVRSVARGSVHNWAFPPSSSAGGPSGCHVGLDVLYRRNLGPKPPRIRTGTQAQMRDRLPARCPESDRRFHDQQAPPCALPETLPLLCLGEMKTQGSGLARRWYAVPASA